MIVKSGCGVLNRREGNVIEIRNTYLNKTCKILSPFYHALSPKSRDRVHKCLSEISS